MAKITNDTTITFSYKNEEMFNDVSLLSAYMTKNLAGDKGSMMDEFTITDDEKDVYEVCVKQALPSIYESMLKISFGVTDAFGVVEAEGEKHIQFSILNNDAYNSNVLSLVDATLNTCIKYGILAEFYSVCANGELFSMAQNKFLESLAQLKQRLFQLKKKAIAPLPY
jgi:hypothetical protein